MMQRKLKSANIIRSFKILKGNTRTCIVFKPLWNIPFNLFKFYLSMYMKSMGITNQELGYLISIELVAASLLSLSSGTITNILGRKRTLLIFDLICSL